MDKDEIIRQLKRENESLKGRVMELVAKLAMHDDTHTPPSLKRGGKRKKDQNDGGVKKPGQKKGHKGVTRPPAKPDRQGDVMKDRCPDCGTKAWCSVQRGIEGSRRKDCGGGSFTPSTHKTLSKAD
jgi:hypothetical protein